MSLFVKIDVIKLFGKKYRSGTCIENFLYTQPQEQQMYSNETKVEYCNGLMSQSPQEHTDHTGSSHILL